MATNSNSQSRKNWPPYEDADEEPWRDVVEPTKLVLAGQSVYAEADESTPLYVMNQDVTTLTHKSPTVTFERVELDTVEDESIDSEDFTKQRNRHLFYLAHPAEAHRRAELGASYYITSVSRQTVGNVKLEKPTKSLPFQKPEFRALLSENRSAWDSPLFDKDTETLLFDARPRWKRGRYEWLDSSGKVVAFEDDAKDGRCKLVVTIPLQRESRDALVALWCLRLWHDSAQSKGPETVYGVDPDIAYMTHIDTTMMKRTAALASVGAGAGC
ncbi:hypothetical protein F5B20DRAFT_543067 [Whalleya microplaca]|nr:hypothetical protein F5B20DRAFT_543067 [Whalleya microplaca]